MVRGRRGERRIAAEDFFLGLYATALEPGEIVTAVVFPVPGPDAVWGFEELSRRRGDYALVGLAATGRRTGGRLTDLRLAFFGVADRPILARAAAAAVEAGDVPGAQAALAGELDPPHDPATKAATRLHLARIPDVWRRPHQVRLERLPGAGEIDWSRAGVESASVPAKHGGLPPA